MTHFPDDEDAIPGDIAQGSDGLYYRLSWSGEWTRTTKGTFLGQEQRKRREAREEKKLAALERAAAAAPPPSPALPPPGLSPSPFLAPEDA